MPHQLSDSAVDLQNLPMYYSAVAAADVAVGAAGTYVDAVTLGTLPPGIYLVTAQAQYLNGAGAAFVNGKLLVGTQILGASEQSCIVSGSCQVWVTALIHVTVPAGSVVKLQVTSTTATGSVKAADANGGANTGTTYIHAVRLQ